MMYQDVTPAYSPLPLGGIHVVIDPGHGGMDAGASYQDILEKDLALSISLKLRDYFELQGAEVTLTREGDYDLSKPSDTSVREKRRSDIYKRVKIIEDQVPDLVVSVHLNAIEESVWRGAQTFYYPTNTEGEELATAIQSSLIKRLKNTTREIQAIQGVYLLKQVTAPMALVEVGFLSNEKERALLLSEDYQEKVARSIFYGMINYLSANEK
ncbi:MAG: N-acetylmuramoyl-L-alanine amidase [Bacillota bacterium]